MTEKPVPSYGELLGLGIVIAAAVVLPMVLGLAADHALHSSPAGTVAGLLLGIVMACMTVYQRFKRYW